MTREEIINEITTMAETSSMYKGLLESLKRLSDEDYNLLLEILEMKNFNNIGELVDFLVEQQ